MLRKTAVVLLNVGGPLTQKDVYPFLLSFFSDPAILRYPLPVRFLLARLIAKLREKKAKKIYGLLGGGSPLLKNTQDQARALQEELGEAYRVFVAMRHTPPFIQDVAREVEALSPEEIILLPLTPQYSTTTTASFFTAWGESNKTRKIESYPLLRGFLDAMAEETRRAYEHAKPYGIPHVLFTAHGLPEKIIKQGDPYQGQVEQTAEALKKKLKFPHMSVCYQSRVGPFPWLKPYLSDEIIRLSREKRPLVVVPISFVSEHSETLVELDITFRTLALREGCPAYERVPTVQTHPLFIKGLASCVRD